MLATRDGGGVGHVLHPQHEGLAGLHRAGADVPDQAQAAQAAERKKAEEDSTVPTDDLASEPEPVAAEAAAPEADA